MAAKDAEIERLNEVRSNPVGSGESSEQDFRQAFDALQGEQDDLLLMLSDQESKINEFKKRLADVGHPVNEDE